MVGMILDVFPSYKDKDMVDTLYQYERETRLSLNILVEKYLEKLLYDNGYLTMDIENETENTNKKTLEKPVKTTKENPQHSFTKGDSHNGKVKIIRGNLDYGYVPLEDYSKTVNELSKLPSEELQKISRNNWGGPKKYYSSFLQNKLENPSITMEEYIETTMYGIYKNKGKWSVRMEYNKKTYYFGRYSSINEAKEVRNFLIKKNWDIKYSTAEKKLKGEEYIKWIKSEMDKEQTELIEN